MAREVLAIIKKDPKLVEYEARLDKRDKEFKQQLEFIKKNLKNARDAAKADADVILAEIEAYLLETKSLEKPVNKETHHLCFGNGTIDLHHNQGHRNPLDELLARLFGADQ